MEDQQLGDLLRELPRVEARPGFTARVLARLDEAPSQPRAAARPGRLRFALAASTLVLITASAAFLRRDEVRTPIAPPPATAVSTAPQSTAPQAAIPAGHVDQTLRELRSEHDRLRQELAELQKPGDPEPPSVLYVGGNDEMDLVIDLSRVRPGGGRTGGPRRASHHRDAIY